MEFNRKYDPKLRSTKWCALVYPESAPEGWLEYIESLGAKTAISPLHDKDLNEDGSVKKPHYHVILDFTNARTWNSIYTKMEAIQQPLPFPCESIVNAYDYFTHKGKENKHQYLDEDIKVLNGFDITRYATSNREIDKEVLLTTCMSIIASSHIMEFADLVDIAQADINLLMFVVKNTHFLKTYINSRRYRTSKHLECEYRESYNQKWLDEQYDEAETARAINDVVVNKVRMRSAEWATVYCERHAPELFCDTNEPTWCGACKKDWEELYSAGITEND